MSCLKNRFTNQEALVCHANAALTPRARLRLARLVVDEGWTYTEAAKMLMVAPRTARKWADRYQAEGAAGMADRSSCPSTSPTVSLWLPASWPAHGSTPTASPHCPATAAQAEAAALSGSPDLQGVLSRAAVATRANPVASALVRRAAALARGDRDEVAALASTFDELGAHYQRDRSRDLGSSSSHPPS